MTSPPRSLTSSEHALVAADNAFTFSLLRVAADSVPPGTNVFVSPFSIAMALSMTYSGAEGDTRTGMANALQIGSIAPAELGRAYRSFVALLGQMDPGVDLRIANSIWYHEGRTLDADFVAVNRDDYSATIQPLDFSSPTAPPTINAWAAEQTAGRIETIVDELPADAVVYLANATYFKSSWANRFPVDSTRLSSFRLVSGATVMVPTMTQLGGFRSYADNDVAVVDLPYARQAFVMTLVVPLATSPQQLLRELSVDRWNDWIGRLDSTLVLISLPRFVLRYDFELLRSTLGALGMQPAFCGQPANFTGMISTGACISDVRHRTFVEVNEEGTEAAAATGVIMADSSPLALRADRPFFFAIRERYSGAILFAGVVSNPLVN